jgi:gamma-glutamyltranspeptidase/glutathione hydrolase
LRKYRTVEREPVTAAIATPQPSALPPSASGIHVVEMLNVLEGYDVAGLGFGTPEYFHLIAEVLKIGFSDRDASTGDPDFLDIPVARLISKEYAAIRRREIDPARAGRYAAGPPLPESAHTTHVTTADADGNLVAMTQTLNNLFGSRVTVPGTGVMLNNNMALFDPHPGRPNSVAPGKRMRSSMAPTIVTRDGRPVLAVGLPGGVRISTSVMRPS